MIKKKLLWLALIPVHTIVALAYLENNGTIQLPPTISTACGTTPDPNDFSIKYTNPECLPKWRFWYRDPVFNPTGLDTARLMRLTDALNMGLKGTAHIYSSINAFNEGKTKIIIGHRLLNGSDQIAIHDIASGTYTLLPPGYGSAHQPRWSRTDPNIVYLMPQVNPPGPVYIKQYDVSTGLITNVGGPLSFNGHTYDSTVQHPSEDDICFGGDHLIKRVKWQGTEYVVVFSISQQLVVGEYAITGLPAGDSIDNVELAPAEIAADRAADRNDIVLVNFSYGEPRADSFNTWGKGMWKFTFDETRPVSDRIFRNQQALTATSHHDLGLDDDGTPIMVTPNGSMYNAVPGCQGSGKYGMEKVSLVNPDGNLPSSQRTTSKCLMNSLDWATLAVHVSVADHAGWAYMDVYLPASNDTPSNSNPTANWKPYANEIVLLKLDGTAVRRLAHHRARLTTQWYNQPNASVSRDGKTLVFGSNFGYGNYDITQYNDVYLIDNINISSGGTDSGASTHALAVSKNGSGTGTVTSSPDGINCGTTCNAQYTNGTVVTLSASPGTGAVFTGWGGVCTGTGSCTVTMDSAKTVTATFDIATYALGVSKSGFGTGTVASSPVGINCGVTCSAQYASGAVVTLSAAPDAGSAFAGWGGACTGSGTCTVTVGSAKSVTATFDAVTYTLGVSKTGSGIGTVTSAPAGINCGTACNAQFSSGTLVTLSAAPDAGSAFAGWSGACTGSGICTVTVDSAKSVTATFDAVTYTLGVSRTGSGIGAVTSAPAGINCGTACNAQFSSGTLVTLSASPGAGSIFAGWGGACTGTGSCTVTMDSFKSVTATFDTTSNTLSITKTGSGTGTVTSSPAGIDCGTACSAQYSSGTLVTLSASPGAGSAFAGWGGSCTGSSICTLTIDSAKSVTAIFNLTTTSSTYIRVEQTASSVSFNRPWLTVSGNGIYSGGSANIGFIQGDRVTFSFNGTSAKWIGFNLWAGGIANVYVDGVLVSQIDTFSSMVQAQQVNYTTPQLPSGPHTLTIEATGTKNANAGATWIWVDAFEYLP